MQRDFSKHAGRSAEQDELDVKVFQAVKDEDEKSLRLALEAGGDPDAAFDFCTPLVLAVHEGNYAQTALLVEFGADVNRFTKNGWTPLKMAVASKQAGIAGLLLKKGANVNACDLYGETPLMSAVCNFDDTFVPLLLAAGADPSAQWIDGDTALDWAKEMVTSPHLEPGDKERMEKIISALSPAENAPGAPSSVGGDFSASGNRITSLDHLPKKVIGRFNLP